MQDDILVAQEFWSTVPVLVRIDHQMIKLVQLISKVIAILVEIGCSLWLKIHADKRSLCDDLGMTKNTFVLCYSEVDSSEMILWSDDSKTIRRFFKVFHQVSHLKVCLRFFGWVLWTCYFCSWHCCNQILGFWSKNDLKCVKTENRGALDTPNKDERRAKRRYKRQSGRSKWA